MRLATAKWCRRDDGDCCCDAGQGPFPWWSTMLPSMRQSRRGRRGGSDSGFQGCPANDRMCCCGCSPTRFRPNCWCCWQTTIDCCCRCCDETFVMDHCTKSHTWQRFAPIGTVLPEWVWASAATASKSMIVSAVEEGRNCGRSGDCPLRPPNHHCPPQRKWTRTRSAGFCAERRSAASTLHRRSRRRLFRCRRRTAGERTGRPPHVRTRRTICRYRPKALSCVASVASRPWPEIAAVPARSESPSWWLLLVALSNAKSKISRSSQVSHPPTSRHARQS